MSTPSIRNRLSAPLAPSIWMPRFLASLVIPGAEVTSAAKSRPFGMRSMVSAWTFAPAVFCLTSMSGDSPVTLIGLGHGADLHGEVDLQNLPELEPHVRRLRRLETLQRRRHFVAARPECRKPIGPGVSVTVVSTPARDGLRASTVTPGSTPPELSRTVPSIEPAAPARRRAWRRAKEPPRHTAISSSRHPPPRGSRYVRMTRCCGAVTAVANR